MENFHSSTTKDGTAQNQTTDQQYQKDDWQDHIAKLLTYSKQLKDDYHTQGKITHQLAKAEWRLSLRSLALISIFLGCFASGFVVGGRIRCGRLCDIRPIWFCVGKYCNRYTITGRMFVLAMEKRCVLKQQNRF